VGFLVLGAGGWEKVGAIAAVIAAVAGVLAIVVTWVLGRSSQNDARSALRYERLAGARRLVGEIGLNAGNTNWARCEEAQAQLRPLLPLIGGDLPQCSALVETVWSLETYGGGEDTPGVPQLVAGAREELERASLEV
jgi:hypothetical protein